MDEVTRCYMLAGEADFLLKVVANWDQYQRFVDDKLTAAPNVVMSNR